MKTQLRCLPTRRDITRAAWLGPSETLQYCVVLHTTHISLAGTPQSEYNMRIVQEDPHLQGDGHLPTTIGNSDADTPVPAQGKQSRPSQRSRKRTRSGPHWG